MDNGDVDSNSLNNTCTDSVTSNNMANADKTENTSNTTNTTNTTNIANTAEFTLFPKLPNEIQAEIWRQAVEDAKKPPRMIQIRSLNGGREFTTTRQRLGVPVPPLLIVCHASRRIAQKVFDKVEKEFWPAGDERKTSDYPVSKDDILYVGTANNNFWEFVLRAQPPDEDGMPDPRGQLDEDPICGKCNIAIALEFAVLFSSHWYLAEATSHLEKNGLKLYFVVEDGSDGGPFRFTRQLTWERYQWFGAVHYEQLELYNWEGADESLDREYLEGCIVDLCPTCNHNDFEVVEAVGDVVGQWTYGVREEGHRTLLMRTREGFATSEGFLNG